jgi:sugar lactone lactonase YvrE
MARTSSNLRSASVAGVLSIIGIGCGGDVAAPVVAARLAAGPSEATRDPFAQPNNVLTLWGGPPGDGRPKERLRLLFPGKVKFDSAGNAYIPDGHTPIVYEVDAATGIATAVAGNGFYGDSPDGPARVRLNGAQCVELDEPHHLLYIGEAFANKIRAVDLQTGLMMTVAGTGAFGFSGDGGLATAATITGVPSIHVDPAGNLYFTDANNHRVRRIDYQTGIITTIAGSGKPISDGDGGLALAASFNRPSDLLRDDVTGAMWIGERNGARVRYIDPSGVVTTIAGGGSVPPYEGALGTDIALTFAFTIARADDGSVYFSDSLRASILRLDTAGIIHRVAGSAVPGPGLDFVSGPALEARLGLMNGINFGPDHRLYVSDSYEIRRLDGSTLSRWAGRNDLGDGGPAIEAQLTGAVGTVVDSQGRIFVADRLAYGVRGLPSVNPEAPALGVGGIRFPGFSGDGGPATSAEMSVAIDMAIDVSDNLFVADIGNGQIRKIDASGTISTVAAMSPVYSVTTDPARDIVYATDDTHVWAVDRTSGARTLLAGDGVCRYAGDGGPATAASLCFPFGGVVDPSGEALYVADGNNVIRKIDLATGVITTVAGNGIYGFSGDGGMAVNASLANPNQVDLAGDVLVIADTDNGRIRAVNLETGIITTVAGSNARGYAGNGTAAGEAAFEFLFRARFDRSGNLLISDNYRVRMLTEPAWPSLSADDEGGDDDRWVGVRLSLGASRTADEVDPASIRLLGIDSSSDPVAAPLAPAAVKTPHGGFLLLRFTAATVNAWSAATLVVYGRYADGRYFSGVVAK